MQELQMNLTRLVVIGHKEIVQGMELWGNAVVDHMQANHQYIKPGTPNPAGHPDPRFYTHTQQLVNSMHIEDAVVSAANISVKVLASETYAENVENGTPNSRAYPFMGPALIETKQLGVSIVALAVKRALGTF